VTSLALTIYGTPEIRALSVAFPIVIKPLIYSALFSEFWIRPYKRKLERMLATQIEQHVDGAVENQIRA
jgi:hypothetical protein